MELTTFIHGSAHDLHQLADQSVQMIATSPPYYGLRAYAGEQGVEWPEVTFRLNEWVEPTTIAGCDPNCVHEWTDGPVVTIGRNDAETRNAWQAKVGIAANPAKANDGGKATGLQGAYCSRCGGWRGGLGMEPSPVAFIGHLILCLREWRRVLRDDGVCFVNLGDSYAGAKSYGRNDTARIGASLGSANPVTTANSKYLNGLKSESSIDCGLESKNLLGIPWLFAIAARADGWYLRSDIIWAKPNPMPESVTDRPTKAHEYVFLLSKSARYFWDAEGVKEKAAEVWNAAQSWSARQTMIAPEIAKGADLDLMRTRGFGTHHTDEDRSTRNLRTVWTIPTQPTPFAHFATFPEKLVETMIRAGSSERGACPHCGKAWVRRVERGERVPADERAQYDWHTNAPEDGFIKDGSYQGKPGWRFENTDLGFFPACTCPAHEPVPCVVLDPFNGSGTTGKVAVQLGRAYVGVDIATEYLDGVTSERFGAGVQIGMGM